MSDARPSFGSLRAAIFAATAIVAALVTACIATRPNAHELFLQGLAASRQDPALGENLFRRAVIMAGGRFPDARKPYGRVRSLDGALGRPRDRYSPARQGEHLSDLLLEFGRDAIQHGHRPEGVQALEAASQHDLPAGVAALELLKTEYHEAGLMDKETAALYRLTQLESDNGEHWKALTVALGGQRKFAECEAALRDALQQELPEVYRGNFEFMLIRMLIWKGEVAEPSRKLTVLKKLEGESFRVSLAEIDVFRLQAQWQQAQKIAAALSPDANDLPAMYRIRGILHLDLDQYEEAARDFERSIELLPFDELVRFKLSETYRLLGRADLAAQHAKAAAEITDKRKRVNETNADRKIPRPLPSPDSWPNCTPYWVTRNRHSIGRNGCVDSIRRSQIDTIGITRRPRGSPLRSWIRERLRSNLALAIVVLSRSGRRLVSAAPPQRRRNIERGDQAGRSRSGAGGPPII